MRQTFVAELVGDDDLPNAGAPNSSLFSSAQLIGPAVAGVVIAATHIGWVFLFNAVSFVAVIAALMIMRVGELHPQARVAPSGNGVADGSRYVRRNPDLMLALTMLFLVGTYGLNFPVFISTMSVTVFHGDAHLYGPLSSTMAAGSVAGALLAAGRAPPGLGRLTTSAFAFGTICGLAALMPNTWLFGAMLIALGVVAQTFTTATNSLVQSSTEPSMRGRVMAIYIAILLGCTPLGASWVGSVADAFGARWALAVGAASGFAAGLTMGPSA